MTRRELNAIRRGTTLIELLCVLLVLTAVTGVATLAIRRSSRPDPIDPYAQIALARRNAIETGVPQRLQVTVRESLFAVSIGADGTVRADSSLHVDRLSGVRREAPR